MSRIDSDPARNARIIARPTPRRRPISVALAAPATRPILPTDSVGDCYRRCQQADEEAANPRAQYLRRRAGDLEARVFLREPVTVHQLWQQCQVGDIEEDTEGAGYEGNHEQLPHRQHTEQVGERNQREHCRPAQVRRHEDRTLWQAVDPRPGGQSEKEERQKLDSPEHCHLECAGVQDEDRHERQREDRDPGAELADALGDPQLAEVILAEQAAIAGESGDHGRRA